MAKPLLYKGFKSTQEAYEAYVYHRLHPTPRQLAGELNDAHKHHLERCERCKAIYDEIMKNIDKKHATAYCDYDGSDFNSVQVGDIRTLGFDMLAGDMFQNSPEYCVLVVPPKLSYTAEVVLAQAIPERFELLMDEGDIKDGGYIIESWNIISVPMMALIDFNESRFPTVCKRNVVKRETIRFCHGQRGKKAKVPTDKNKNIFRATELEIARNIKELCKRWYLKDAN